MKKMGDGSKSGMGRPKPIVDPRRPMPVAPVVVWVIAVRAVLMQRVGVEDAAEAVF